MLTVFGWHFLPGILETWNPGGDLLSSTCGAWDIPSWNTPPHPQPTVLAAHLPPPPPADLRPTSASGWLIQDCPWWSPPLPGLLHLSPLPLSPCGKGLGSSYPLSQPHLKEQAGRDRVSMRHLVSLYYAGLSVWGPQHPPQGLVHIVLVCHHQPAAESYDSQLETGGSCGFICASLFPNLWVIPGHTISAATGKTNFFFFSLCSLFVLNNILRSAASP